MSQLIKRKLRVRVPDSLRKPRDYLKDIVNAVYYRSDKYKEDQEDAVF